MKETAYLLQAALISGWWLGLALSPRFFAAFQFAGIPPVAFWAFFAPDVIFIALLSAIRAYRNIASIEFIILGAFGYAALYCGNAALLTGTGLLPAGVMLLGLAYNAFLCFNRSMFREARSTSVGLNAVKTFIQSACIWIIALGVIPYILLDAFGAPSLLAFGSLQQAGVAMFVGFSLLGMASSFFMVREGDGTPLPLDQTNRLVVSGPYRYVRNPMAISGIGQAFAVAIFFQSFPILIYSILGAIVWHLAVRPFEERDLVQRFGDSYVAYRDRVRCWIPRLYREAS